MVLQHKKDVNIKTLEIFFGVDPLKVLMIEYKMEYGDTESLDSEDERGYQQWRAYISNFYVSALEELMESR